MVRKLKSGEHRLYFIKKDAQNPALPESGHLQGITVEAAKQQHEREVRYFKRQSVETLGEARVLGRVPRPAFD